MKTHFLTGSFLSALIFAQQGLANVKVDMAAGLWDHQFTYTGDSAQKMQDLQATQMQEAMAEMKKQFANMPAEQRQQMEALMAQSGVSMDAETMNFEHAQVSISKEGTRTKNCITQDQIDRGELANESDDECQSSLTQVGKNRYKSVQSCSGESPTRTEMEVVFDSPKHYKGNGVMTHTVNGQVYNLTMAMEGTWLASDCGNIKPD